MRRWTSSRRCTKGCGLTMATSWVSSIQAATPTSLESSRTETKASLAKFSRWLLVFRDTLQTISQTMTRTTVLRFCSQDMSVRNCMEFKASFNSKLVNTRTSSSPGETSKSGFSHGTSQDKPLRGTWTLRASCSLKMKKNWVSIQINCRKMLICTSWDCKRWYN